MVCIFYSLNEFSSSSCFYFYFKLFIYFNLNDASNNMGQKKIFHLLSLLPRK